MATTMRPMSSSSTGKTIKVPKSDGSKSDMWSSLLDSVASGKRLPEKRIMLLGGSSTTQKEFLDVLDSKPQRKPQDTQRSQPAVANDFAMGYTYQEVLDADQEDILARLSIYTLQNSSPAFSTLIQPLFTPATIPDTLLVILLDWSEPWNWITQLRDWIRMLHAALSTLDEESRKTMQEVMQDWEQQRRGGAYDMGLANAPPEANVTIPLGPGEWDEALGFPLCVVCHNADQIDVLEREHGWGEAEFDYVLQFLRTILLKHGASLVYTSNSVPNTAPLLIQYSLGIRSILKRESLKHNVIDRDKILIPPNWDSWGKIKVLRDGFDFEGTSSKWSLEIQPSPVNVSNPADSKQETSDLAKAWNDIIKNPTDVTTTLPTETKSNGLETETIPMQGFLDSQIETIERLKSEEAQGDTKGSSRDNASGEMESDSTTIDESSEVREHVGPIQINMGGINLNAENMLNHFKEKGSARSSSPEKGQGVASPASPGEPTKQNDPEQLANFFASLIKKTGNSGQGTPPRAPRGA